MPQIFLDPTTVVQGVRLVEWTPDYPIPKHLRDWGYCPNYQEWLPGDLVLVSALEPGFIAQAIRAVQGKRWLRPR